MTKRGKKKMSSVMTLTEVEKKLTAVDQELEELDTRRKILEEMKGTFLRYRQIASRSDGSWTGLKLQEALRKILADNQAPLSTKEIAAVVIAKGIRTTSKKITNVVYVTMKKRMKEDGYTFVDGKWGLKEWKRTT